MEHGTWFCLCPIPPGTPIEEMAEQDMENVYYSLVTMLHYYSWRMTLKDIRDAFIF